MILPVLGPVITTALAVFGILISTYYGLLLAFYSLLI